MNLKTQIAVALSGLWAQADENGGVATNPTNPDGSAAPLSNSQIEAGRDAFDELDDSILDELKASPESSAEEPPALQLPQTPAAPPSEPAQPATPPVAPQTPVAPAAPATPPATGAPAAPQTPAPAQPAQPAVPAVQPPESLEDRQARETRESQAVEREIATLAQQYQMSEDDARTLLLEPEKILPTLAARVHANIIRQIQSQVLPQSLPAMLQQQVAATAREAEARDAFYSPWKGKLDPANPQHVAAVQTLGMSWRQLNPTAPPETAIDQIGRLACAALGISVEGASTPLPQTPSAPHRPAAPGGPSFVPTPPPAQGSESWGDIAGERGS